MPAPGQNPGQPSWDEYVDALVREHGSIGAVAKRLAETRGFRDDVESIARALRRLRARGTQPGGQWGARVLATFGLPRSVEARLRFMGSYHSRFVDLPVSLCTDLVQLWDRPPTSESRSGRLWLSLARATLALRARAPSEARAHLDTARAVAAEDLVARIEIALAEVVASSEDARPSLLAAVPGLLAELERADAGEDLDCLRARYVGQASHVLNHQGEVERAEALHRALPDLPTTAPFARSRRANGIAYGCYRRRAMDEALEHARLAVRYAGDAGHVRLRAMALLMVARVAASDEVANDSRERARVIARALEDEVLLARCDASRRSRATRRSPS